MTVDGMNFSSSKVLIADDNPQILELLEAYLEPLGVQVVLATDGQAAFDVVERQRPDLILLDIMMPKHSGFEVCRVLKDDPRYNDISIIMVTALNEVGDMERARESGADDFLCKPVNKTELLERVSNLLKIRRLKKSPDQASGENPDSGR
ncbi:MAG: response regulator [Planctomycetota bacterium]